MMSQQTSLLEVNGISKHFGGVIALNDVSLTVAPGEHVALVGDNGAGKSTLIKIITGVLKPDEGHVWFDGEVRDFRAPLQARLCGIETVYQDLALAEHLGVVENIFLGREHFLIKAGPFSILHHRKMKQQATETLERTGVRIQKLDERISHMSGGQRQGVAIARAAGWGSKLILLDEPTAALGVAETERVEEIIRELKRQGIASIIISHNMQQVFRLADTVWVLRHGQMVGHRPTAATTPDEIVGMITGANLTPCNDEQPA